MNRIHLEEIPATLTRTEFAQPAEAFGLYVLYVGFAEVHCIHGSEQGARGPCALWAGFGQTAKIRVAAGSRGVLVRLPNSEMPAILPEGQIAGFVQRSVSETTLVRLSGQSEEAAIRSTLDLLLDAVREADPMSREIVRLGVAQVICRVLRSTALLEREKAIVPQRVVHEFCRMVDQNMHAQWTVARYATEIGVTRDHLQSAVKRTLSKSPLEYIHARLLDRSKSLLKNSDLTVAEIAYRLGYSDAAYFNRAFKKQTGIAPGRYRKAEQDTRLTEEPDVAFSAWP